MISIIYPFFNQHKALAHHHLHWMRLMHEDVEFEVILVDDHSDKIPAVSDWSRAFPLRLFRVDEDKGWNITGAKNIGMHEANSNWCFVGDLDHLCTLEMMRYAMRAPLEDKHFYIFPRRDEQGRETEDYHENFMLIRKKDFWHVGGYDEDFAGGYGWEDVWFKEMAFARGMQRVKVPQVFSQAIGDIEDACMPAKLRDSSRNGKLLQRKRTTWINSKKARLWAENSNPLRCKYHEVV